MPDPCGSSNISLPLYHHLFLYRPTCGNVGALRDHLTPHLFVSPSVCVSSFHHSTFLKIHPPTTVVGCHHRSVRPSVRLSVYMQDPAG